MHTHKGPESQILWAQSHLYGIPLPWRHPESLGVLWAQGTPKSLA